MHTRSARNKVDPSMPFKPAPANPELEALLKRSAEITAAMTLAQRAEQSLRQSVSYVRGEMGIEHPEWSEERLNEVTQHMPQAWALAEIDRLRAKVAMAAPVLAKLAYYFDLNDCEAMADENALEIPIFDLRAAKAAHQF